MSIYDRIMLFFSALLTAVSSAVLFLALRPSYQPTTIGIKLHDLIYGNLIGTIFLGLIIVLVVFYLLSLSVRSTSPRSVTSGSSNSNRSIVKAMTMGNVRISLSAIDDLVTKVLKKHSQVKDATCGVDGDAENLSLNVKMDVYTDAAIPALCAELEKEISEVVLEMIGLEVKSVNFDIASVSGELASTINS